MADAEQVALLRQGAEAWNQWRRDHPEATIDLSGVDLRDAAASHGRTFFAPEARHVDAYATSDPTFEPRYSFQLRGIDLSHANLADARLYDIDFSHARFRRAYLTRADLERCNLTGADLAYTFLHEANLSLAYLRDTNLSWSRAERLAAHGAVFRSVNLERTSFTGCLLGSVIFNGSNLSRTAMFDCSLGEASFSGCTLQRTKFDGCNLSHADFSGTRLDRCSFAQSTLVGTDFRDADISGTRIYGSSVWDIQRNESTVMNDLVITADGAPVLTVDDIEVAQFIYLLLNNARIRNVIDTVTSKSVLILGRFTPERKQVLDALRHALRTRNFLPILFDFDRPERRDLTETVATLAQLSCFVIADITAARSIPQELLRIIPSCPSLPLQPILQRDDEAYAMFADLLVYGSVLPPFIYDSEAHLLDHLGPNVVEPALRKLQEIATQRARIRALMDKPR